MNSKRQAFQTALRKKIPNVVSISNPTDLKEFYILKKLGLDNVSKNIIVSISPDSSCLNIQLRGSDISEHILFQIPLEIKDLSSFEEHPQKDVLYKRYNYYYENYRKEIIKIAREERTFLQKIFPHMIFNQKIGMKSEPSYIEKLDKNISSGKTPFIDDIIAERIMISEFNGSTNPQVLNEACYHIAKALDNFRKGSQFQVKALNLPSTCAYRSELPYISKDYIKAPKEKSNYQSLHVTIEHITNADFRYELQIRTLEMEENAKKSESQAHTTYKPRYLNDLSISRLPKYTEVTHFIDSNSGKCVSFDLSVEDSFYNYYSLVSLKNNGCPITYSKYIQELKKVEKYINFREIRNKLKLLPINAKQDRDDIYL